MNVTDFITRQEFKFLKLKATNLEEFKFESSKKVSDGTCEMTINGHFIGSEYTKFWDGENYIVSFQRQCNRTNNIGGSGHAVPRSVFEKMSYEEYVADFEGNRGDFFPENYVFFNNMAEQLSIFD